jgi:hypothetical protein
MIRKTLPRAVAVLVVAGLAVGVLAAVSSSATTGACGSRPRLSERHILRIAERTAARAGDRRPSLIQHAEGPRAKANRVDSGEGVPGCRWSYLIAERGHFVLRRSEGLGTHPPRGTVLTLVIDAATARGTDGGVSNRYPDLDRLGPVTTDLRTPATSRRAGGKWCPKLGIFRANRSAGKIFTTRWVETINARYQRKILRDCPGVVSVGVSDAAIIRGEQQRKRRLPPASQLHQPVIAVGVKARRYTPRHPVFLNGIPLLFQVTPGLVRLDVGTSRYLSSRGRTGTLSGVLSVCCNAEGRMPEAGVVAIKRHGVRFRLVSTDHRGHFSVRLPVGEYGAVGGIPRLHWKLGRCHLYRPTSASPPAFPVVIRPEAITRVLIGCQGQ